MRKRGRRKNPEWQASRTGAMLPAPPAPGMSDVKTGPYPWRYGHHPTHWTHWTRKLLVQAHLLLPHHHSHGKKTFPKFPWNYFPWKHRESMVCRMRAARKREATHFSTRVSSGAGEKKQGDSQNCP